MVILKFTSDRPLIVAMVTNFGTKIAITYKGDRVGILAGKNRRGWPISFHFTIVIIR